MLTIKEVKKLIKDQEQVVAKEKARLKDFKLWLKEKQKQRR